jgi:two-component system, NtrC family, nitrogen regulation sensor histidine kinase NtrY
MRAHMGGALQDRFFQRPGCAGMHVLGREIGLGLGGFGDRLVEIAFLRLDAIEDARFVEVDVSFDKAGRDEPAAEIDRLAFSREPWLYRGDLPGGDADVDDILLGADAARTVQLLMRRSLRMGVVSREIETVVAGRVLHLAVTVSSLGPRRANTGFVLVLDDLTEMLRAQKTAAWQEVARRIAHEIKNPLTPIQLSSQRLSRFLDRREPTEAVAPRDPELTRLVQECSRLIEREVSTLAALVNEFSQFVRFPVAKLSPANANTVVHEAIEVFAGRLDGITLKTSLAENLPPVRADAGLLRSVVVNLIDNAAEALETAPLREILVSTCAHGEGEMIEICVLDTGHGISPEDKDHLFLPHFSTKDRGTGLGLAIAARIIAEHGGTIYVEDNFPAGSRFIIELPAAEPASTAVAERNGVEAS